MLTAVSLMRLDHIAEIAVEHLLGWLIWRAFIALVCGLCAITALYHLTIGGLLTLELHYATPEARLIIGAIYAVLAIIALAAWWRQRRTNGALAPFEAIASSRELQLLMLLQAMTLATNSRTNVIGSVGRATDASNLVAKLASAASRNHRSAAAHQAEYRRDCE